MIAFYQGKKLRLSVALLKSQPGAQAGSPEARSNNDPAMEL